MSIERQLRLAREGAITRLIVDRPERRNALSLQMWARLPALIAEFEADPSAKVLILQGAQAGAFAAGADIEEILAHAEGRDRAASFMATVHRAEQSVADCAKPTIAMIRGTCFGGGIELGMACDIRFASSDSRFAVPPSKLGVILSFSSTRRLVRLVGPGIAADLLYSGRTFDAVEAHRIGLVERLIDPGLVETETAAYAQLLCQRSQVSIRGATRILHDVDEGLTEESDAVTALRIDALLSPDVREGANAFLEKRGPSFPSSS